VNADFIISGDAAILNILERRETTKKCDRSKNNFKPENQSRYWPSNHANRPRPASQNPKAIALEAELAEL